MEPMRLSIVIPAHNEENRIGPMLEAYLPYFTSRYQSDVEFLVVVNGSTDRTDRIVASFASRFPGLKAIIEPKPIGKGGALMVGFSEACGELVGFVDADGATPPQAFQDLVDNIGEAGGIIASRWSRGAIISPRQPLDRRIASRMFNLITLILFGLRLVDTQCGAKLMTRAAMSAILPHLGITQWAFDVDLLFQLRRAGYKIKEIPTTWHDVAGSKIQVGRASAEMILAVTRLRLLYSPFHWVVMVYDRYLGPWIHPVGAVRDHLLTHSLILFIGAQFSNVCNLLYQVIMARMLGNAEYGVLSAILSALMMLGMPLAALGGGVTHFTALFMARNEREKIKAMMAALTRDLVIPALLLIMVALLARQELMAAFKIDSPVPIYLAIGAAVVGLLGAIPGGVLSGMQAFKWGALIGNGAAVLRLIAGLVLALMGLGAVGGLTAHVVGLLVSVALSLVICGALLGRASVSLERPAGIYAYMGGYMAAFTAYGVLSGADLLLVKYYFSPEQAGVFSKAAMVARMVFFLPGPVCSAMFPKVTSGGESSQATTRTLYKAMVITGLIVASMGLVFLAFPGFILKILVKEAQPGQIEILRGMVLALTPLTMVMVLLNYELAQRRFRIMIPLFICAAGYLFGVAYWHETLLQVVAVLAAASVAALLGCLAYLRGSEHPHPNPLP
jgi:O-antigen/teichoic acid export membrane protein/glycosyltransferase involved in cell wall biosynthesis